MTTLPARLDFPRPAETAAILVAVGQARGLSAGQCLAGTGLTEAGLAEPGARLSAREELTVIRNLIAGLGRDVPLGLEAGQRYGATTFGIWGFAVLNAQTMRQAVEVGVRFARLTSAWCAPRIEEDGDQSMMVVDMAGLPEDVSQFLLERDAAILMSIQRSILPVRVPLQSVRCTFPRPVYHRQVDAFFGVEVQYDQPDNAITVHRQLGDIPIPRQNTPFFRRCEQECQRLLDEEHRHAGLAGQVREAITRYLHEGASMARISDSLGLHPRTLRRHLLREQLDYMTLLEETRQTLAEKLLTVTDYSVEDIARQLGYRQTTNFIRAFRRWHGTTPLQWRHT